MNSEELGVLINELETLNNNLKQEEFEIKLMTRDLKNTLNNVIEKLEKLL